MKRFASILFGKLTIGALIICAQFGWLVYLVHGATVANSIVDLLMRFAAIFLAIHVANKDMRTSFKMSWIFLILCLPVFGVLAYFLFGRSELTKRKRKKMAQVAKEYIPLREEDEKIKKELYDAEFYAGKQSDYITHFAGYPLYREDETQYYAKIEELFPQFLEDLKSAEHFIFLEYFIIEPGKMFDAVLEILEEKVKAGVLVRLIYDDVGCITTLPSKYYRILRQKGIACVCFNPFRPVMSVIMNNRDHRKIAVVDGRVAYTGGFNLADEYINEKVRFGHWKDAGIRMTGDCVWSFTTMFMEMWTYITGTVEDCSLYRYQENASVIGSKRKSTEEGFIQPYSDSPMDREYVGETVYLNMIAHAKKYVYIFTPYLIVGSEMMTALISAAKCGVDVRIVVPGIPDKKMVYMLAKTNFEAFIEGGVKIYKYTPGFIHSKCFVVDDVYAAVGTINLDFRSLCLHFECGAFMYRTHAVMQVKQDMLDTFEVSKEVTLEEAANQAFFVRLIFGELKFLAPLL